MSVGGCLLCGCWWWVSWFGCWCVRVCFWKLCWLMKEVDDGYFLWFGDVVGVFCVVVV